MDELKLCLVTDRSQTGSRDLVDVVGEALAAGLPAVQLREKDLPPAELVALARRLREVTHAHGAALVVNDRVDVALAVGADAVQRTTTSMPIADMRIVAGNRLRVAASVHSRDEAVAAEETGADWIVFGPMYDTPSKRRYGAPQGIEKLEAVAKAVRTPIVAIGGITPARVPEVLAAGACGVAVIAAILAAPSPAAATREFLDALARHA
ncbi:MAG: thiamine phosphate synthase [Candidatus Rokubacteria bacterium]|nr:thiamine phosphate synthase [Candidatus Rokubacteria bacterium]